MTPSTPCMTGATPSACGSRRKGIKAMNENARAWVTALRSGEYKQGKGALHPTKNTYCCLGVACELYRQANGGKWQNDGDGLTFQNDAKVLPLRVRIWLGLNFPAGAYPQGGVYASLAAQNDSGATFSELADVIESEPAGLFADMS